MTLFSGFRQDDFKTNVRGARWCNRRALGGGLCLIFRRIYGRRYQSWDLPSSKTIHIARRVAYTIPLDKL